MINFFKDIFNKENKHKLKPNEYEIYFSLLKDNYMTVTVHPENSIQDIYNLYHNAIIDYILNTYSNQSINSSEFNFIIINSDNPNVWIKLKSSDKVCHYLKSNNKNKLYYLNCSIIKHEFSIKNQNNDKFLKNKLLIKSVNKESIREGELLKYSFKNEKFEKRYVILDKEKLLIKKSKEDMLMIIFFIDIVIVTTEISDKRIYNNCPSKYIFEIKTKDSDKYYLSSKSLNDLEAWIDSISYVFTINKDNEKIKSLTKFNNVLSNEIYSNEIKLINCLFSLGGIFSIDSMRKVFLNYSSCLIENYNKIDLNYINNNINDYCNKNNVIDKFKTVDSYCYNKDNLNKVYINNTSSNVESNCNNIDLYLKKRRSISLNITNKEETNSINNNNNNNKISNDTDKYDKSKVNNNSTKNVVFIKNINYDIIQKGKLLSTNLKENNKNISITYINKNCNMLNIKEKQSICSNISKSTLSSKKSAINISKNKIEIFDINCVYKLIKNIQNYKQKSFNIKYKKIEALFVIDKHKAISIIDELLKCFDSIINLKEYSNIVATYDEYIKEQETKYLNNNSTEDFSLREKYNNSIKENTVDNIIQNKGNKSNNNNNNNNNKELEISNSKDYFINNEFKLNSNDSNLYNIKSVNTNNVDENIINNLNEYNKSNLNILQKNNKELRKTIKLSSNHYKLISNIFSLVQSYRNTSKIYKVISVLKPDIFDELYHKILIKYFNWIYVKFNKELNVMFESRICKVKKAYKKSLSINNRYDIKYNLNIFIDEMHFMISNLLVYIASYLINKSDNKKWYLGLDSLYGFN